MGSWLGGSCRTVGWHVHPALPWKLPGQKDLRAGPPLVKGTRRASGSRGGSAGELADGAKDPLLGHWPGGAEGLGEVADAELLQHPADLVEAGGVGPPAAGLPPGVGDIGDALHA